MDSSVSLAEVNAAISKILASGQTVRLGSREVTRADLKTLYTMKKELESSRHSDSFLGNVGTAYFDRR